LRSALLVAAACTILASGGLAQGCSMTTSAPEVDAFGFYVDNDLCQECISSVWIYQESNLIDGLQRGDEVVDDTCGGVFPSDRIVF
jgi:hypothetical protein